jgi:putative ABC transport system permease protein
VSVANVTFASLCFVVAGSLAVLVTVASLDHLRVTPPLAGATWDGVIDPRADEELVTEQQLDAVLATLASDPRVADVGTSGWSEVIVNGTAVPLQVFGDGIGPATASGRAPRGPGELALGADEMRRLGVGIGDRVRIAAGPDMPAIDAEVVGQSILVAPIFRDTASGDGAATNVATMVRLGVARLDAAGLVLVRFALGADVDRELARVTEQIRGGFAFSSRDRIVVEGIERVRAVPIALVLVLALLGAAGLTHVLLVSARYRRGDLAVLRTIGFTRRQVLGAMTVQAVALAGATILAGGPVGVVGGRLAWERIAGFLRVVPDPRVPAGVVGPVAAAVVALATLVALPTGWHATRNRPARVLRAEQR